MTTETRVALLSDVHADVLTLRQALDQADRLGCSRAICAGDLVGVGPFPDETLQLLRERQVLCVVGNHDLWAIGRNEAHVQTADGEAEAWDARGWGLSEDNLGYLSRLRWIERVEIGGVPVAACHGTPRSVMEGIDPTAADAELLGRYLREVGVDVLHVGHIHTAFALMLPGGGMVVNPGSLGQEGEDTGVRPWAMVTDGGTCGPWTENVRGTFGVLELPTRRFTVHRAHDGREIEFLRRTLGVVDRRCGR